MMLVLTLQNLVAYSVNMADNLMLGSYSQNALSGAATVNQIFFMVQQFALAFGNALVVLASQYWGENRKEPIRVLTGIALKAGLFCGIVIVVLCTVMPKQLLGLFTNATGNYQSGTWVSEFVEVDICVLYHNEYFDGSPQECGNRQYQFLYICCFSDYQCGY